MIHFCVIDLKNKMFLFFVAARVNERKIVSNDDGNFIVEDSEFYDLKTIDWRNTESSGAALFVCRNKNNNVFVKNSTFSDCVANLGGSIYVSDCFSAILNSSFVRNIAEKMGGAIVSIRGTIQINSSNFLYNYVSANHGAAAIISPILPVKIIGCQFIGNKAGMSSGALSVIEGNTIIKETVFAENKAGHECEIDVYTGRTPAGGALWLQGGSVTSFDCIMDLVIFDDNRAIDNIQKGSDIAIFGKVSLDVNNSRVYTNGFYDTLSVYYVQEDQIDGSIKFFENQNYPEDYPKKLSDYTDFDKEINSPFTAELSIDEKVPMLNAELLEKKGIKGVHSIRKENIIPITPLYGPDYFVESKSFLIGTEKKYDEINTKTYTSYKSNFTAKFTTFVDCIALGDTSSIKKNKVFDNGGVIAGYYIDITISSCDFTNNYARNGGAVYALLSNFIVNDSSIANNFKGNRALYDGSAVFLEYSNFSITNVNFQDNNNTDENGKAAVYFFASHGNLTGVNFKDNSGGSIAFTGYSIYNLTSNITNVCFAVTADSIMGYDIIATGNNVINTTNGYFCSNRKEFFSLFNTTNAEIIIDDGIATFGETCTVCKMDLSPKGNSADEGDSTKKKDSGLGSLGIIFIVLGTLVVISVISIIIYVVKKNQDDDSSDEYYSDESTKTTSKSTPAAAAVPKALEEVPSVSLKNPMCTVSVEDTSDSLFDDIDVTDDVGEI